MGLTPEQAKVERSIGYSVITVARKDHIGPISFLFLLLFVLALVQVCSGQLSVTEVFDRSNPAIVTVVTPDGFGSGFIVSSDGIIVTNYHVIQGAQKAAVKVLGRAGVKQYNVAGVINFDDAYDYAVLKIPASGLRTLKVGDSDTVHIGDKVVAIGNPRSRAHHF